METLQVERAHAVHMPGREDQPEVTEEAKAGRSGRLPSLFPRPQQVLNRRIEVYTCFKGKNKSVAQTSG